MKQFSIGDIVYVSNYKYKNGKNGINHSFVIIDDGQVAENDLEKFINTYERYLKNN